MPVNNRKILACFFILLIPLALFLSRSKIVIPFKNILVEMGSIPVRILSFPVKEIKKIFYYRRTFDEYKHLKKEINSMKSKLVGLEEVILENTRLEKMLEFKRRLIYSSVAADVIGREPSCWNSAMIIDKGYNDGVRQGQSVVNALGVVGKIAEVSKNKAKVILLIDPQFSVAALVKRPRESGLISGTLQGVCRLKYLNERADVRVGDKIITSKLSYSFPEGLMIGEVIEVNESTQNPSLECVVQPSVSLSRIEEVLVILK